MQSTKCPDIQRQKPPEIKSLIKELERSTSYTVLEKALNEYNKCQNYLEVEDWKKAYDAINKMREFVSYQQSSEELDSLVSDSFRMLTKEADLIAGELETLLDIEITRAEIQEGIEIVKEKEREKEREGANESQTPDYGILMVENPLVDKYVNYFLTSCRDRFARWIDRSGKYLPMMKETLRNYGLPEDLIYLSMIESGFNPHAYSSAHAVGLWQFIKSTGSRYGLIVNDWVDERRDPVKSTDAAANHLLDLYEEFQENWFLAFAAYNCGAKRVWKEIERGKTWDYWKLNLPEQTRNYVPLILAAMKIGKSPDKYGFDKSGQYPDEFERVLVPRCTSVEVIANCAGTSEKIIQELNPELRKWCTPPGRGWWVNIPKGKKESFEVAYNSLPKQQEHSEFIQHRVRQGDTLSNLSRKYGASVKEIQATNKLRNCNRLSVGQLLTIPVKASKFSQMKYARLDKSDDNDWSEMSDKSKQSGKGGKKDKKGNKDKNDKSTKQSLEKEKTLTSSAGKSSAGKYKVKRGDNLGSIAKNFNVSVEYIKEINGIRNPKSLKVGQILMIPETDRANKSGDTEEKSGARLPKGGKPSENKGIRQEIEVRQGDTLSEIAMSLGLSVDDIRECNHLGRKNKLNINDKLVVYLSDESNKKYLQWNLGRNPKLAKLSSSTKMKVTHQILKGDTLLKISKKYRTTPEEICTWNKIDLRKTLYPGDQLVIWLEGN